MDNPIEINRWLGSHYGNTLEGYPLFRVIWSTGLTEHRKSRFIDHVGDTAIRDVVETREVLRYPFAQNRWILERIVLLDDKSRELGLQTDAKFTYGEIYTFQDANCNALPLRLDMVQAAMYLFFKFYLSMTLSERINFRMEQLAQREMERRKQTLDRIGELRSSHGIVFGGRR